MKAAATRVALLGATGSIGQQALEVIEADPALSVCALASGSQPLDQLAAAHGVEHVQVGGDLTEILETCEPDIVLNAVAGFAGVGATLWSLERGVTLALANKESLVAAGKLAVASWGRGGGRLLPVDSEHSALFQCLEGRARETVDSATLANKGLELIEAHYLFGLEYERIDVVVHPTSVVHALVRFRDGAALAHLGYPDMRVPISYALTHPERRPTPVPSLDFTGGLTLEFELPDPARFPMLRLAREAGERGGTYPCAFNAANEVAVAAFLDGRIEFLEIASLVEDALDRVDGAPARDLPELVEADAEARRVAEDSMGTVPMRGQSPTPGRA